MFSPKAMISFRSARKLSSYLVRAELYSIQETVRSFKCTKKRCEVSKNVNITESFISSITEKTYKINHKLTCNDKYLN